MEAFEVVGLPDLGIWAEPIYWALLAGGTVVLPLSLLCVVARVYRYALTVLVWMLGR